MPVGRLSGNGKVKTNTKYQKFAKTSFKVVLWFINPQCFHEKIIIPNTI